jgi:hypothetical protein
MCSNSLKTNERDLLKSPKNQEMQFAHAFCFRRLFAEHAPDFLVVDKGLLQGTALAVPKSAQDSEFPALIAEATPELREINRPTIYEGPSHCSTLLTGSGPHSKTAVTCRKQTTAHVLTGSRIAHSELRTSAKMREETSRIR